MAALIAWQNWVDAPGVAASSTTTLGDLGPSNVLTRSPSEVWRGVLSTGSSHRIRVDLGALRTDLRFFALAAPRDCVLPGAAATARFVASAVAEDGEEAANVYFAANPFNTETGLWCVLLSAPITARWIHWRILGAAGDTYWQAGRAWAGPCLLTASGIAADWQRAGLETGESTRSKIVASRFPSHGRRIRRLGFTLPALTSAEAAELRACALAVGTSGQAFAAPFATATGGFPTSPGTMAEFGVLGTFTRPPTAAQRADAPARYRASIQIDEEV